MSISSTTTNGLMVGVGPMSDPPHPGEIIREEVIRPLGLSVTETARALGVTRQALSAFLNERSDLSPEMALRIETALGPKADVMMGIQMDYDMARARSRMPEITATVRRIKAPTS
jgi:addiction module HigA family antidote